MRGRHLLPSSRWRWRWRRQQKKKPHLSLFFKRRKRAKPHESAKTADERSFATFDIGGLLIESFSSRFYWSCFASRTYLIRVKLKENQLVCWEKKYKMLLELETNSYGNESRHSGKKLS